MEDLLYHAKRAAINNLFVLFAFSCSGSRQDGSKLLYLDIYGDCEERIVLSLDHDKIYEKRIYAKQQSVEVRRGPFYFDSDDIEISLEVDGKDTTFVYPLKDRNYWSVGYSKLRNEFQFGIYDSTNFFFPKPD